MKILSLSPYPLAGPSSRYRVYAFQAPLAQQDVDLNIKPFLTARAFKLRMNGARKHPFVLARLAVAAAERIHQARTARAKADVIYIHRQTAPVRHRDLDQLFIQSGVPLVFDMDDAVFTEYPIDHLLRACAAVTVGNEYLAAYVRTVAPQVPVTVVPTTVDTEQFTVRPPSQDGTQLVAGWIGTASTFRQYLLPVLPALVHTAQAAGAEFRVIASHDVQAQVEVLGGVFVPWTLETEVEQLQRFDVGVMPLLDDAYVRGKCAFKLIQYGAVGIPGIGTDIGANGDVISDGVSGFLTNSAEQMQQRLSELLASPALRREMGQNARRIIEERFSLTSQVPVMERVFRDAARHQQGGRDVRH